MPQTTQDTVSRILRLTCKAQRIINRLGDVKTQHCPRTVQASIEARRAIVRARRDRLTVVMKEMVRATRNA
jgi:RNase P/RNase MRP subunit POP5